MTGITQTVWIYINTAKEVGDVDHPKVFASEDAAARGRTAGLVIKFVNVRPFINSQA